MDLEALKAEFAARGGKVTKVEPGARAYDEKTLAKAAWKGEQAESLADAENDAADAAYRKWENGVQNAHAKRAYGFTNE